MPPALLPCRSSLLTAHRGPGSVVVAFLFVVVAGGCTFDRSVEGATPAVRCAATRDCPPSQVCVADDDGGGRCLPADAACITSVVDDVARVLPDGSGCGAALICVAGGCVAPTCGDDVVTTEVGETCDGSAGCRPDCTACGDGVVDDGEDCDSGARNSDSERGACRTDCTEARCGDGVRDPGEGCDDGVDNDDSAPDACRTTCVRATCGDGVVDDHEDCDDGAGNDDSAPDACRTTCVHATCGDGVVDDGEACDEGAANSDVRPDACRMNCVFSSCGDGARDLGEECDEGPANDDTAPDACRTSCLRAACGDGIVDDDEECDEGADNNDVRPDACRTTCVRASCGDGVVDDHLREGCDEGRANDDLAPNHCRSDCRPARCGDGTRDLDEQCDDGDANHDDLANACRTDCSTAHCGDGVIDGVEECDDGDHNGPGTRCSAGCRLHRCGDGDRFLGHGSEPPEECDDGNDDPLDGCVPGCRRNVCGDRFLNVGDGTETCDDGNTDSFDGCSSSCTNVVWRRSLGAGIAAGSGLATTSIGTPPVPAVLVGTDEGALVALAVDDGRTLASLALAAPVAAIAVRDQRAVVATDDGTLTGVDLAGDAPQAVFSRVGIAENDGRARVALGSDGVATFVDAQGRLHRLAADGADAVFTTLSGAAYPFPTDAVVSGVPASCGQACVVTAVEANGDGAPAAALTPFVGAMTLWNFRSGCAPIEFGLGEGVTVIGRAAFYTRPDLSEQMAAVSTSDGNVILISNGGHLDTCDRTRFTITTASPQATNEPLLFDSSLASGTLSIVVASSDGLLHNFAVTPTQGGGFAFAENFSWPAPLTPGRSVRVPAALDLQQNTYVIDDVGDIARFDILGGRVALGSLGAAPAAGVLLADNAVVAVGVDGTLAAFEGAGDPLRSRAWGRDGGDDGNTSSVSLCSSTSTSTAAPLTVLLGLLGLLGQPGHALRRRRRAPRDTARVVDHPTS